jgi:hypothetical protein
MSQPSKRRRPVEAIAHRTSKSADCEQRVRKALPKLVKTGAPFTVENVCDLAGVGKTFIYDKRHPELTKTVRSTRCIPSCRHSTRRATPRARNRVVA